jgi:acyl-CoA synthetase (AMP-forming)/AMP-acid ligase II
MPAPDTLAERLLRHARDQPERMAFRIAATGEEICFGDLVARAAALGRSLPRGGAPTGVAIACERAADFVVALAACFLSGNAAVPLPVALSRRSAPRASAILALAMPRLAVVGSAAADWLLALLAERQITPIRLDGDAHDGDLSGLAQVTPDTAALVQFSSGSTGDPKGVLLRHRNLAANCASIAEAYDLNGASHALSWLPLHHDMGLVGHVIAPMWSGFRSTLMDPLRFLQRPLSWLQTAGEEGASITSAPNFAYEMCCRAAAAGPVPDLSLGCLETMICGGEPVLPDTVRRFISTFAPFGLKASAFAPSYGLAEATLLVSSGKTAEGPAFQQAPGGQVVTDLGPPVRSCSVRFVGDDGQEIDDGAIGEVEINGPSVGELLDAGSNRSGGRILTGDFGFRHGGRLFLTGRKKEMIILRGQNVYPTDIESAAMRADESIVPGGLAAVGIASGGTEELVLFVEVERKSQLAAPDVERFEGRIREQVALATGITPSEVIALRYGSLPRTSSGKVRRGHVAEAHRADRNAGVAGRLRQVVTTEAADGLG